MIEAADETYLVADSTKIGRTAFAALGALDRIQYLITDAGIRDEDTLTSLAGHTALTAYSTEEPIGYGPSLPVSEVSRWSCVSFCAK